MKFFYPKLLRRTCRSCQDNVYEDDPNSDEPIETDKIQMRYGLPLARPPGCPTPCHRCPKGGVEAGTGADRAVGRAFRALDLYYRLQATQGIGCSWAVDPLISRNLGIVEQMVRQYEQQNIVNGISQSLGSLIVRASIHGR